MVTLQHSDLVNEYVGNSTDELPVDGVPNGSLFYEMDTMNKYIFDSDDKVWRDTRNNGHDMEDGEIVRQPNYDNKVYPIGN